jgi:HemK-like putative methylase
LQYVLGSQPFGPLDVKCRPGVLIPRPETEAYVFHLAELVERGVLGVEGRQKRLRVLDFCTGTGCIPLLLYYLLHSRYPELDVRGFDISDVAVSLARENLAYNVRKALLPVSALEHGVSFENADIFSDGWERFLEGKYGVDVLVSNPPYISTKGFNHDTGRSVRNFEPKLALVPLAAASGTANEDECEPEDVFYARLFEIAETLRPKVMLFEVGDLDQALRVAQMTAKLEHGGHMDIEIWRDWPDMTPEEDEHTTAQVNGTTIPIRGSGNGRSVLIHCRS